MSNCRKYLICKKLYKWWSYAALAAAGAFFDATSKRIFEETGKGMLANL